MDHPLPLLSYVQRNWQFLYCPVLDRCYVCSANCWPLTSKLSTVDPPTQQSGADPGGGAIPPVKPTILNFITILYNSGNSIGDIRSFCRPVFCHSSVVEYTSSLLQQWTSNETCLKYITETPLPQPYWLVPILPAAMITAVWITQLAGLQYHVFSQYTQESLFHYIYH